MNFWRENLNILQQKENVDGRFFWMFLFIYHSRSQEKIVILVPLRYYVQIYKYKEFFCWGGVFLGSFEFFKRNIAA